MLLTTYNFILPVHPLEQTQPQKGQKKKGESSRKALGSTSPSEQTCRLPLRGGEAIRARARRLASGIIIFV